MATVIGVSAQAHGPVRRLGEILGDDVNRAGGGFGAVEQCLSTLQNLHAVNDAGGERVERRSTPVEAIVQPHPIQQPQYVLGT